VQECRSETKYISEVVQYISAVVNYCSKYNSKRSREVQ
jgi:hypothetical protein